MGQGHLEERHCCEGCPAKFDRAYHRTPAGHTTASNVEHCVEPMLNIAWSHKGFLRVTVVVMPWGMVAACAWAMDASALLPSPSPCSAITCTAIPPHADGIMQILIMKAVPAQLCMTQAARDPA